MKKLVLAGLVAASVLVGNVSAAGLGDELKDASSGSVASKFRGGFYIGAGYQGTMSGDSDTSISGILLEGGLYGLFNPIENFVDLEVGVNGKYNTGMSTSNSDTGTKKYYSGLAQATVYGGPVFRFGNTKKAIALGLSKALYLDEQQSSEQKDKRIPKNDLENGLGAYIEYQSDSFSDKTIFFVRVEVEKINVVSTTKTSEDTVGGILIGVKY